MMYESYLDDKNFLRQLDLENRKRQFIRLSVLKFKTEELIANIDGVATGGNINLNGSSNVRRALSCSLVVNPNGLQIQGYKDPVFYNNVTEVQNLISLNKKVSVFIGFENTLKYLGDNYYPEHDIIWIPLGIYIIKAANIAKSSSGINISLTLNDKTMLLNGDTGGVIPAATVLSEVEEYNADASVRIIKKLLIKDIIKYLIVDLGGEDPARVFITDIPDKIVKVMKWVGDSDLYYYTNADGGKQYSTEKIDGGEGEQVFPYGRDVGYMQEDFVYPGKLECNAGDTVAAMLDKIKNVLGNYEWFYDVLGNFHFQEKKNYLNKAQAIEINNLDKLGYLKELNMSKSIYTFNQDNKKLLTNISSAPQYQNIKNDFIVWGSTKTATGTEKPIRYHLAFDTKPNIKDKRLCIVYTDYRGLQSVIILKAGENYTIGSPTKDKTKYNLVSNGSQYVVEAWDEENQMFRIMTDWEVCYLTTDDWRTELYFRGLEDSNKVFAKNYYAAELNSEWPKIYDVRKEEIVNNSGDNIKTYKGGYRDNIAYEYWLDFIENDTDGKQNLSQFNVNNIGRRTVVGKDNTANCIFAFEVPLNLIYLATGTKPTESQSNGYDYVGVSEEIFNKLVLGGKQTAAYDKVKDLLQQHTSYNEAVTLTTIPIYYLEPNTIIHIEDNDVAIGGDYLINTISLPLTIGTSSISCIKSVSKTI